jgi:hypothetical protein
MKRSGIFLLLGLTLLLFGGTAFIVAEDQESRSAPLVTNGIQATATITEKEFFRVGGSKGTTTYRIVVVNHGANDLEARTDVLKEQWDRLEKGQDIDIVYLSDDPRTFDIGNKDEERALLERSRMMEMVSPLFVLVGLALAGLGLKAASKEPFL